MPDEPLFPDVAPEVSYRRYLLMKMFEQQALGNEELALTWLGRIRELPDGTALPDTFPFKTDLAAAGYVFYEDLVGATEREIQTNTSLAVNDSRAVVDVFATLPVPT